MTQRVRVQCAVHRRRGRSRAAAAMLLSGVMLAVAACSHAPRQVDAALPASVDVLAAEALEAGPLAGVSVAVVRDGRTVVSKGYGLADIGRGVPATAETIYPIGSLTKQFTAAAILQLVEAGRLSLDDDLGELLPDFPTQGHHVTVRHLLNHTSGIADHTDLAGGRGEPGTTRQAVVDLIAAQRFDFAPGERFSYSNSGYLLLGLVIEKVTGGTYASYLDEHVFERAGLRQTSYCPDKPGPGQARGYDIANGALVDAQPIEMAVPFAAGGLCSTVGDLLAWSEALRERTGRLRRVLPDDDDAHRDGRRDHRALRVRPRAASAPRARSGVPRRRHQWLHEPSHLLSRRSGHGGAAGQHLQRGARARPVRRAARRTCARHPGGRRARRHDPRPGDRRRALPDPGPVCLPRPRRGDGTGDPRSPGRFRVRPGHQRLGAGQASDDPSPGGEPRQAPGGRLPR